MAKSLKFRLKVLDYRKNGYSIKELSKIFGIAKSTASVWTRDVEINEAGALRLAERVKRGPIISSIRRKNQTNLLKSDMLADAYKEISENALNQHFARLLCALVYWCEGSKSDKMVRFTNSDPELAKYFIDHLVSYFGVTREKIKVRIHLHQYHDSRLQHDFWSAKLGLPISQFFKPYLKPNTGTRIRLNYPGCVSISYYDTIVARKLLFLARAYLGK